ncbi:DUF2079 domain-containing protein [Tenuifilum osseticum]|uniref:DUF2079 domain-containing protein n=1 Tax=Tenuifilum osseticum TaxID=3374723 RepID=UPI0034E472CA
MHRNRKQIYWFVVVLTVFFIVFCSISLVNHYLFRTYALDLGMFNQALRNVAQLQKPTFTLGIAGEEIPFLATHFSPIIFLFTPLYFIFGNYTLLIVQIVAILFGGAGIFLYSKHRMNSDNVTPIVSLIHFLSMWGIYSALTYDFHSNVLGAMLVPWLFLFYERKQYKHAFIVVILAILTFETMTIWFAFIIATLAISSYNRKKLVQVDIPLFAFCVLSAIIIIWVAMPLLQSTSTNLQFERYRWLGETPMQVVLNLILSPINLFKVLFTNTTSDVAYDYIKLEFHIMVLVSGGILFLLRPRFLFMLIPIYMLKMIPNDYNFWGINNQYSIEFVPILSIAAISTISEIKINYRLPFAIALAIVTAAATAFTMENRVSKWYDGINTRFYSKQHYQTEFNIKRINEVIRITDGCKAVSASSRLAPHLNARKIYSYPFVKDAEYILLLPKSNTWPLSADDFKKSIDTLSQSQHFTKVYSDNDLLIFKRNERKAIR